MEPEMNIDWIHRVELPTFAVRDGVIEQVNYAAAGRLVTVGERAESMLLTGQAEYHRFTQGWLSLTVRISGVNYQATVQRMPPWDIFSLQPQQVPPELQVLSLAAQKLRLPLSGAFAMAEHISSGESGQDREDLALLRRNLYQLLRIVQNMDDGVRYLTEPPRMEIRDVGTVMEEIFDRAGANLAQAGCAVTFKGLSAPAYSLIDSGRLDQTICRILSNSAESGCGQISARLTRRGNTLYLTLRDNGPGLSRELSGNVFAQYLREPLYEPGKTGLGMGLSLISSFAAAHNGSVLLEPGKKGLRLTMSLPIRQEDLLGTPKLRTDLTGGRDVSLVELSQILPWELYDSKKEP